jgi:hypothetical protein
MVSPAQMVVTARVASPAKPVVAEKDLELASGESRGYTPWRHQSWLRRQVLDSGQGLWSERQVLENG